MTSRLQSRRLLLAGILAGAALTGLGLQTQGVSAHAAPCRSDPIVTLSDGTTLDLAASIATGQGDIHGIVYVIHAPASTQIKHVTYTQNALGGREWFSLIADEPVGTYDTDTVVFTGSTGVPVTTTTTVAGTRTSVATGSASGYSGQDLHVRVTQGTPGNHP